MRDGKYPECEKLSRLADKRTIILDFIEWLAERDMHIMVQRDPDYEDYRHLTQSREALSHQYLEIDDNKLEQERRAMIEELQNGTK